MTDKTGKKSYGWTGRILRVNLTDGTVSTFSTEPYKGYIGGMGLANKIMFDEVPAGTDPLSEENKVVFAVGPLTASGVPLAGRTTIASLSTYTKDHQIVDAHCGGMLGARIKQAGYDAIVIEGKSDRPVYVMVDDDDVKIKSADGVWGLGTRATTELLCSREGHRRRGGHHRPRRREPVAVRLHNKLAQPFRRRGNGHGARFEEHEGAGRARDGHGQP